MKQRIALFGMVAVALIFAACVGDSGNNGTEVEGGNSSSGEISSSGWQIGSSSSGDDFSSSSISSGSSSSSDLSSVNTSSSSSAGASSSSAKTVSSSSSFAASSSSVVKSSSSSVGVSSSSVLLSSSTGMSSSSSSIKYSSFIYGGQTYKTVTIGTQTWMAENLNYADSIAMPNLAGNSWCYGNSLDSCAKYGRLYTWTGAMNIESSYQSVTASSVISTSQQGACPTDWHVPTDAEWTTLETAVGGSSTAGTALKSTGGWYSDGNGTDAYGFSALPGGNYLGSDFSFVGYYGYWWTATEYSSTDAYNRHVYNFLTYVYTYNHDKSYGRSLRCLKD